MPRCPVSIDVGAVRGERSPRYKSCSKEAGHEGAHECGGYVMFYARPGESFSVVPRREK
jgi:hypothetical protein